MAVGRLGGEFDAVRGVVYMAKLEYDKTGRLLFTKEMKDEYTILLPMMASIQFRLMRNVFDMYGYKTVLLETSGPEIAQVGLKYVHNDTCYPALLVIGQRKIRSAQDRAYDNTDRRRLPRVKLYSPAQKGSRKGGA